jgi:hypothetical protein
VATERTRPPTDILTGLLPPDLLTDPAPEAEAARDWLRKLLGPDAERASGVVPPAASPAAAPATMKT